MNATTCYFIAIFQLRKELYCNKTAIFYYILILPCHEDLKQYLEELKAISNYSPLITEIDGSLIDVNDISAMVKQFCTRYKINFHVYSLRHAFATDLIQSGTGPRTVQDLLGHASFSMSMDYARSTEQDRVTAINKIKK